MNTENANHLPSKCAGAVCKNVAVVTKGDKRWCHACAAFIAMDHNYAPYKNPDTKYERPFQHGPNAFKRN